MSTVLSRSPVVALLLLLPALAGCDLVIDADEHEDRLDADGDGFVSAAHGGPDCDDDDAKVNPDALELCNDRDDDCDDEVDEEPLDGDEFVEDGDGDGYPGPGDAVVACDAPGVNWVEAGTRPMDCHDGDATIHPDADEICDGIDQDCDEDIDEGLKETVYRDSDGDGWGDSDDSVEGCPDEGVWSVDDGDCDETDAEINPGAEEVCGNEVDEDCSGLADTCPVIELAKAPTGQGGAVGDGFGYDVAAWGGRVLTGAPGYGEERGLAALQASPLTGNLDMTSSDLLLRGTDDGSTLGRSVDLVGGVVSGVAEAIVAGAPAAGDGGEVYLVDASRTGIVMSGDADATVRTLLLDLDLGMSVSWAGDLDDDGQEDLLLGAPGYLGGNGAAVILPGPLSGTVDVATQALRWGGEALGDEAGRWVEGAGDVDGDGIDDALVGAWLRGKTEGATYLLRGPITGDGDLDDADARLLGISPGDVSGFPIASRCDLDGDGRMDFAVGAVGLEPTYGGLGVTYVFAGVDWLSSPPDSLRNATATITQHGSADLASDTGVGMACRGDVDADGQDDLFLGHPTRRSGGSTSGEGYAYLFYGPISGAWSVDDAGLTLAGDNAGDLAGHAVAMTDADGDGASDLFIGAPGNGAGSLHMVVAGSW